MYYTYIMRCEDGSLYTGITTDVNRRFKEHQGQRFGGAKYTKGHMPIKVEVVWKSENRSLASKLEYRLKKLSKENKEKIIKNPKYMNELLSEKLDTQIYILMKKDLV